MVSGAARRGSRHPPRLSCRNRAGAAQPVAQESRESGEGSGDITSKALRSRLTNPATLFDRSDACAFGGARSRAPRSFPPSACRDRRQRNEGPSDQSARTSPIRHRPFLGYEETRLFRRQIQHVAYVATNEIHSVDALGILLRQAHFHFPMIEQPVCRGLMPKSSTPHGEVAFRRAYNL